MNDLRGHHGHPIGKNRGGKELQKGITKGIINKRKIEENIPKMKNLEFEASNRVLVNRKQEKKGRKEGRREVGKRKREKKINFH